MKNPLNDPPLTGVAVVDFTTAAAGPVCTMLLADFGASVIKVEPPGGESGRRWGVSRFGANDEFSSTFLAYNRNKSSVTVDLKESGGRRALQRLLDQADVVVENYRPGVTERLGIDYETLRQSNPGLVYCSISGFGQVGPMRERPAYDMLIQAYTGHTSVTGYPGQPPVRIGHSAIDLLAGAHAAFGIALALRHRDKTGEGQYVDTSLYESGLHLVSHFIAEFTGTGRAPGKGGARYAFLAPYGLFEAADCSFCMGVSGERMWRDFCSTAGLSQFLCDPLFEDNAAAPLEIKNSSTISSSRSLPLRPRTIG